MSTRAAAQPLLPARGRGLKKVSGASLIGTSLEWYRFFLYAERAPEELAGVQRLRPVFH